MVKDFREYLTYLEGNGKLLRVKKEVDPRFDIAAGIRKVSNTDGPALLFENVKDHPGWKVAGGIYATQKLTALALNLPLEANESQLTQRYLEYSEKRIKTHLVETGPVKEIIIKGNDIDLSKLPIPTYSEGDAGPYLTAGVEIAKDPDTGIRNTSIHRRKILSRDSTSLYTSAQHLWRMLLSAEASGEALGIATVMGADPALTVASQIKAPAGIDEMEIAGGLRQAPLEVVKCETIDLEVPANAEIVIEGSAVPGERVDDGPFCEFPGNYITLTGSAKVKAWVIKVTAITMRREPIFQAMLTGTPQTENHFLKKWSSSARAFREASQSALVNEVNATAGSGGLHYVVSLQKKRHEIEPRMIMYSLFAAPIMARQVIVVDDDIDVYNPEEVEWAVATRTLPHKDILIVPPVNRGLGGLSVPEELSARWGIDATMPLRNKQWYKRSYIPGVDAVDYV